MEQMKLDNSIKKLFMENHKCIINADLDGLLSGMLLQNFLNWDIVGFSSCCGKPTDELWLYDINENIKDCVFVDLPVCIHDLSVIDQHFIAFDIASIDEYNADKNKINPNIMRKKVFKTQNDTSDYTLKYPFGTVHFILAVLENLGFIDEKHFFNFNKQIENFDIADLICRADRVIGNTYSYTFNCFDWMNWLMKIGGKNTFNLFYIVRNEYVNRLQRQSLVEKKLLSLGCAGIDGDCSNLFRDKNYLKLESYFEFLSESLGLPKLSLYKVFDFQKLQGRRFSILDSDSAKAECKKPNVFSFAFVTKKTLSLTYIKS